MTLEQALDWVEAGNKATSDCLPDGAVLKLESERLRVVFEATGSGYDWECRLEHRQAEWSKVEGWGSYV